LGLAIACCEAGALNMRRTACATFANIYRLGVKELWSLWRDPVMLVLIVYTFTLAVYTGHGHARDAAQRPIAIVDEDDSRCRRASLGLLSAAVHAAHDHPAGDGCRHGRRALHLRAGHSAQLSARRAGRARAGVQLNVDATRMSQAFTGSGYVQQIVAARSTSSCNATAAAAAARGLALRMRFNPTLEQVLVRLGDGDHQQRHHAVHHPDRRGADPRARARHHRAPAGDARHARPRSCWPRSGRWALVVLLAAFLSLQFVVRARCGCRWRARCCAVLRWRALHLFATTSMGIFMATLARNMPQFGMLMVLTMMPLQMLSGGMTPRESMPEIVQNMMLAAPTTHFVRAGQAILYRGAGLDVVWPQFLALALIGTVLFFLSLARFRKTIGQMA
jgi:ABC-2 type transport system permease protein